MTQEIKLQKLLRTLERQKKGHLPDSDYLAFSDVAQARAQTAEAALDCLDWGNPEMSFADAAEVLKTAGLDLRLEAKKAAQQHQAWGLTDALIQRGVISSPDEYEKRLQLATFTPDGINQIKENLQQNKEHTIIFNPGALSEHDLRRIILPEYDASKLFNGPQESPTVIIKPSDISFIEALPKLTEISATGLFILAAKNAPLLKDAGPTVLFLPEEQAATSGQKQKPIDYFTDDKLRDSALIDPSSSLILLRTRLDASGKPFQEMVEKGHFAFPYHFKIKKSDYTYTTVGAVSQSILGLQEPDGDKAREVKYLNLSATSLFEKSNIAPTVIR